jgi:tetratricopeptide (TPR) repeat protein
MSDAPQLRLQGLAARRRGDRAEALEHFRAAAALDPEKLGPLLDVATELFELARLDEAAAVYQGVLAKDPRVMLGWRGLGHVALRRGKTGEALEHFLAAVELDPDNAWSVFDLATALRELGSLDEAADAYYEIVAKYPRIPQRFKGLAHVARLRGDRLAALAYFRTAAALDPGNAASLAEVATELRELGRPDKARDILKDARFQQI